MGPQNTDHKRHGRLIMDQQQQQHQMQRQPQRQQHGGMSARKLEGEDSQASRHSRHSRNSGNEKYYDEDGNSSSSNKSDEESSSRSLGRSSDAGTTLSNRTDLRYELAGSETRHVCWLRGVVILVLTFATILVSLTMFYSIRQSELDTFEIQFGDHAAGIISAFESHLKEGITSLDHLGVSLVSLTSDFQTWDASQTPEDMSPTPPDNQWPFVNVPEWHLRAASTRTLGLFTLLSFVLVVPNGPNTRENNNSTNSDNNSTNNGHSTRVLYEDWAVSITDENVVGVNKSWVQLSTDYELYSNQSEWNFGNFQQQKTGPATNQQTRQRQLQLQKQQQQQHRRQQRTLQTIPNDGLIEGGTQPTGVNFDTQSGIAGQIYYIDQAAAAAAAQVSTNEDIVLGLQAAAVTQPYLPPGTTTKVTQDLLYPIWHHSPVTPQVVGLDMTADPRFGPEVDLALETNQLVLGQPAIVDYSIFERASTPSSDAQTTVTSESNDDSTTQQQQAVPYGPSSTFIFPITRPHPATATRQKLGVLMATVFWDAYLQVGELPSTANDIQIVVSNDCGATFTFEVRDQVVTFTEVGDEHEVNDFTDDLHVIHTMKNDFFPSHPLLTFSPTVTVHESYCPYTVSIYPTNTMRKRYETNQPAIFTALVAIVFCFTTLVFVGYDYYVERRQRIVLNTAVKSHAIVSSLFPKTVRDRLFGEEGIDDQDGVSRKDLGDNLGPLLMTTQKAKLKNFMRDTGRSASANMNAIATTSNDNTQDTSSVRSMERKSKPIADLFPHTTVLFADIAGFTAWSSTREPSQVFTLLETLYGAFDRIAEKRRVFKVETIGDCYVAATGLPDAQPDHALIMVKFAGDILQKIERVTRDLEVELGPDTGDLALRIGLHSGPVTAGVLRGQKSRFQLFGDTVNTASRMESNGRPNHIQCSQATADLLTTVKPNWVVPRQDKIHAKGKGLVQTYWVFARGRTVVSGSATASISGSVDDMTLDDMSNDGSHISMGSNDLKEVGIVIPDNLYLEPKRSANFERLVDWNVDLLLRLLKAVVARQHCMKERKPHGIARVINPVHLAKDTVHLAASTVNATVHMAASTVNAAAGMIKPNHNQSSEYQFTSAGKEFDLNNPRDEYVECIHLPRFDKNTSVAQVTADDITLKPHIEEQLRDYVTKVACSYHDNPFHNYDHASHVTMSANKILKRIVEAADCDVQPTSMAGVAATLHEYSYGITSDPLTHFACVFSAMIHDVDHPGVSNAQLIKEFDDMAQLYENKSVAEQNSVDLAWGLLMDTAYTDLRRVLFANDDEKKRFRQLLVNSVMATDIFDPDLKQVRNKRWERAFFSSHDDAQEGADLKATIVIEHIIQAADVSHTMQHWHVYQKWNRRLFNEMYRAFKSGRLDKDPSLGWYKGELWFYDNYIIPLAKKLKDCGVFGVSSDEFLNYAMMNRSEWESKGESIVAELVKRAEDRYGKKSKSNQLDGGDNNVQGQQIEVRENANPNHDDSLGSLTTD